MSILAFFNGLLIRVVGLVLSAVLLCSVPASAGVTIEAQEPESLVLQASVFADVHMQSFEISGYRELTGALKDIAGSAKKQDALVFVGDNTMNGQITEYYMFYGLLSRYNSAKNTLVAMGNHDFDLAFWGEAAAVRRHNFFLRSYNRTNNGKPYYSRVINGCTFIILGEEVPNGAFSAAQLAWLDGVLSAAGGKPAFVFWHYSLGWGSPIQEVLERYPNVFFFNGHWHTPLSLYEENGVNYVNLPGLHSHVSDEYHGEGCQVEVYKDRVLLRGRNYIRGEWLDKSYTVELN